MVVGTSKINRNLTFSPSKVEIGIFNIIDTTFTIVDPCKSPGLISLGKAPSEKPAKTGGDNYPSAQDCLVSGTVGWVLIY